MSVGMEALKEKKDFLLAPSILSADPLAIGESIRSLEGEYDWIHVDVMDGHFVPNLSFGPLTVSALRRSFPEAFIDVHIMAAPAESFIDMFTSVRPNVLTIHAEATVHAHMLLGRIRASGVCPGISLNPGTPFCALEPLLSSVGLVLVMSVNPGFGGQRFIPDVISKVKDLVRYRAVHGLDYLIEIDGGVGPDNAAMLAALGCDVLVAGSALFDGADPAEAARRIKKSVRDKEPSSRMPLSGPR